MINFPSLSEECKRKYQQQLLCRYSRPCSPPAPSRRWVLEPACKWGGMSAVSVLWRKPSQQDTSFPAPLYFSNTEFAGLVLRVFRTPAVCNCNCLHTFHMDIARKGIVWGHNNTGLLRWPALQLCRDLLIRKTTASKKPGRTSKSSLSFFSISICSFGGHTARFFVKITKGTLSVNVRTGSRQMQLGLDCQSLTDWTQRGFDCLARTPLHLNFCLVARGSIFRVECAIPPRRRTHPAYKFGGSPHHTTRSTGLVGTICPSFFPPLGYLGKSYLLITEGLLSAGSGVDTVTKKPMLPNISTRTLSYSFCSSRFFWLEKQLHDSHRDKLTHGMSFLSTHLRGNQLPNHKPKVTSLNTEIKERTPMVSALPTAKESTVCSPTPAGCLADTYLQKASCV